METLNRSAVPTQGAIRVRPGLVFGFVWVATLLVLGGMVLSGNTGTDFPAALPVALALGLVLSLTLIWFLPGATFKGLPFEISKRRFVPLVIGCWGVLLAAVSIIPVPWSLLVLVVAAIAILVHFRTLGSRQEILYAGTLAAVAGVAGLGNGHNLPYLPLWQWGLLQVPLTFFGLLAGWTIGHRLGLFDQGIGTVQLLSRGPSAAVRAALQGMVLAVPFSLVGIVLGSTGSESWATQWWAPLVALQPAISEEAYARTFLIGLLILVFLRARSGSLRGAWLGALIVGVYWFAYIHGKAGDVISAALVGTLFNLPLTYVWMRRGLEAAMGFHFVMDGVRWLVVLLVALQVLPK